MTATFPTTAGPIRSRCASSNGWLLWLWLLAAPLTASLADTPRRAASPPQQTTLANRQVAVLQRIDRLRAQAEARYADQQYDLADSLYAKAYRLAVPVDLVRAASLCLDRSSLDYTNGQARQAIARCRTGLYHLSMSAIRSDSAAFKLYSGLGTYYNELASYDSTAYCFGRADELLLTAPELTRQIPLYVLFHFNNQADWFRKAGDYSRALLYLRYALRLARQHHYQADIPYVEGQMAGCYAALGQYDELIRLCIRIDNQQLTDYQRVNNSLRLIIGYHNLGLHRTALAYATKTDRLLNQIQTPAHPLTDKQIQLCIWKSRCYQAMHQPGLAKQILQQGLQKLDNQPTTYPLLRATLGLEEAALLEADGIYQAALNQYTVVERLVMERSDNGPKTTADDRLLLAAYSRKARIFRRLGEPRAALVAYRYAIMVQERMQEQIDTDESRLLHTARQYDLLTEAIAMVCQPKQLLSPQQQQWVFELFELARAGSLRQALHQQRNRAVVVPPALLSRQRALARHLAQPATDPLPDQLAWHQLQLLFRRNYVSTGASAPPLSLLTVQKRMGPKTAYLSYVWCGATVFVLLITNQQATVLPLPIDSLALRQHTDQLHKQLYTNPMMSAYRGRASAVWLYQHLLEPLMPRLADRNRLVVARDWQLNDLPLEVLETGQRAGDYLCRRFAISYAFSAQLFFDPAPQQPALSRPLVLAPFARSSALPTTSRRKNDQVLLASEAEARQIGGDVLLGAAASKPQLDRIDLSREVIYWATHAHTNDRQPDSSFVALGPGTANQLSAAEIMRLSLTNTRLVVLGACAGDSGQVVKGEGALSLARAFAYAGCRSVVTTLWEANDETAAWLTTRLHRYLQRGLPLDRALQQTRLDFFTSELAAKFDHPFYWANFVLLGNYAPIRPADGVGWVWCLAAGGLIGLIGIGWWLNK